MDFEPIVEGGTLHNSENDKASGVINEDAAGRDVEQVLTIDSGMSETCINKDSCPETVPSLYKEQVQNIMATLIKACGRERSFIDKTRILFIILYSELGDLFSDRVIGGVRANCKRGLSGGRWAERPGGAQGAEVPSSPTGAFSRVHITVQDARTNSPKNLQRGP
ncbi:unnamed protein product [Danaus chrysippus]|uniref:(African queen) hypothetical protein n=1 Tax=Danaus chrysippus TaxID=151541 RepID=A0A8J2R4F4_9NEOP|nr:unnamed protein product [Danaus chrysippus]